MKYTENLLFIVGFYLQSIKQGFGQLIARIKQSQSSIFILNLMTCQKDLELTAQGVPKNISFICMQMQQESINNNNNLEF